MPQLIDQIVKTEQKTIKNASVVMIASPVFIDYMDDDLES